MNRGVALPDPLYIMLRGDKKKTKQKYKHFFLKIAMLHIKLIGMGTEHNASIYSVFTHTLSPWDGVRGQKKF